jgi:hypothetical protein
MARQKFGRYSILEGYGLLFPAFVDAVDKKQDISETETN